MDMSFMSFSRLAFGHWEGEALYALAELEIPDCLAERPRTSAEVAHALGCHADGIERLLDCAVACRLLECHDGVYCNGDIARRFLTRTSDESLLHWIRVMARWKRPWLELATAVRQGHAVAEQATWLGDDPSFMREFILGMHEFASRSGPRFVDALANLPIGFLVDVGGGAGTYSIALCKARPQTRALVLDLEPVTVITRETVRANGLQERISDAVVDYRRDGFGHAEADALLFSNVLHQESAQVCESMLARAREALRPGGTLLVQGYFLADDRRAPLFTTLHNLSALALWDGGRSWTRSDMAALIARCGYGAPQVLAEDSSGFCLMAARAAD
jgi:hypothetical protein